MRTRISRRTFVGWLVRSASAAATVGMLPTSRIVAAPMQALTTLPWPMLGANIGCADIPLIPTAPGAGAGSRLSVLPAPGCGGGAGGRGLLGLT